MTLLDLTTSTNDDARRAADEGAPHGATIIADAQSAGRGRGAHRWHSPAGENLYLSTVLRLQISPEALAPLALAIGVAVARASDELLGASKTLVKWPNDVYLDERKLAGVLVEATSRGRSGPVVVAGIGMNVNTMQFPKDFAVPATSIAMALGRPVERERVAAVLLHHLGDVVDGYASTGLGSILSELRDRDFLAGRRVRLGELVGVAERIEDDGRLSVVDDAGQRHSVLSGDVVWWGVS